MDEVEVLDAIEVAAKFEHLLTMCFTALFICWKDKHDDCFSVW